MNLLNTLFLSSALLCNGVSAFAPPMVTAQRLTSLNQVASSPNSFNTEDLLVQASDCSMSESCSIEEAEQFMTKIVAVKDKTKDQYFTNFVIGQLQDKIEKKNLATDTFGSEVVLFALAAVVLAKIMTTNYGGDDTIAMTMQEWYWSIKGGYFPLMVMHFVQDGGLVV